MNAFFVVWLLLWNGILITLLIQEGEKSDSAGRQTFALFFAAGMGFAVLASYLVFARRTFQIRDDEVIFVIRFLGLEKRRRILKADVKSIKQIQDGGLGEDSFPSWAFEIHAPKRIRLIVRQPYPTSSWLGCILAAWAGVDFQKAPLP